MILLCNYSQWSATRDMDDFDSGVPLNENEKKKKKNHKSVIS